MTQKIKIPQPACPTGCVWNCPNVALRQDAKSVDGASASGMESLAALCANVILFAAKMLLKKTSMTLTLMTSSNPPASFLQDITQYAIKFVS